MSQDIDFHSYKSQFLRWTQPIDGISINSINTFFDKLEIIDNSFSETLMNFTQNGKFPIDKYDDFSK